jgi:opacity protein-like surface antigen
MEQRQTIGSLNFVGGPQMSSVMRFHMPVPSRGTALAILAMALSTPGLPADAADLSVKAPPAITYNWTGAYLGVNFGAVFNSEDVTTPFGIGSTNPTGALGGAQLGYNFQFSRWLLGIEGEFDGTLAEGTTNFLGPGAAISVTSDDHWYSTLNGRLGYVTGPLLIFAKGGAAWMNANDHLTVNSGFAGASSIITTRFGWNVGAGVEYLLSPQWSAKVEYDYLDFGSDTLGFVTPVGNGATFKTQINEVKAGVNFHWAPGSFGGL